jgi:S-DNA-T family DNA segregation ATPase FtsK/SpoIIIE
MWRESSNLDHQRLFPRSLKNWLLGWLARCAGIGLLAAGAAGWLSLLTWSVTDPSLTHATGGAPLNLVGPPGAIASDLLLQLLGLAAVFALWPPVVWGGELLMTETVRNFRVKAFLMPLSVLAIAAGGSALPTFAGWPFHHGFGGLLGDFIYNLAASLLSLLVADRAGGAAGLILLAAGLAALSHSIGVSRRNRVRPWQRKSERGWRRRDGSGWLGGRPAALQHGPSGRREPVFDTAFPPDGTSAPLSWKHAAAAHNVASAAELATTPPTTASHFGQDESPAPFSDQETVEVEATFDLSTDLESRVIAARFAPRIAQRHRIVRAPGVLRGPFAFRRSESACKRPSLSMLTRPTGGKSGPAIAQTVLRANARLLEEVLADCGVKGEIKNIKPGPVITLFELEPARGTKSSRVVALSDDIARSMSAAAVRVAVTPGRNAIGIELPNVRRETVFLREILEAEAFRGADAGLPLALGKGISGEPIVTDLARMPHLLVAGTTGSGKSVGINAMVLSLLYKLPPERCRLLMIDPKMLELSVYNGIPHLLTPVVTDPHKAVAALDWAVREMEERYKRMALLGVRNIEGFNNRVREARKRGEILLRTVQTGLDPATGQARYENECLKLEAMPYIVVVVDEFADLMMVAGKEIEAAVQRLAQMARAAGIHLIMATQRPSVDVITGTIKANFPTRISFKVTSKIDSRTILNEQGAEQLLGQGDMLFSPGSGQILRVHGPFVSDEEVETIVAFLREQGAPRYVEGVTDAPVMPDAVAHGPRGSEEDLYEKSVALVLRDRKASTSYIQRRLSVGYNRAADLIERMEREGIVGQANNVGKRDVLVSSGERAPDAA